MIELNNAIHSGLYRREIRGVNDLLSDPNDDADVSMAAILRPTVPSAASPLPGQPKPAQKKIYQPYSIQCELSGYKLPHIPCSNRFTRADLTFNTEHLKQRDFVARTVCAIYSKIFLFKTNVVDSGCELRYRSSSRQKEEQSLQERRACIPSLRSLRRDNYLVCFWFHRVFKLPPIL